MNKITIESQQRQAFLEVFGMFSDDGKLTPEAFLKLIRSIGIKTATQYINRMIERIYAEKIYLTSQEFMKKAYLMNVDFSLEQLHQYFRLLAVDNNNYIPMEKIKRILVNQNKTEVEMYDIMTSLKPFIEGDLLNYSKLGELFS